MRVLVVGWRGASKVALARGGLGGGWVCWRWWGAGWGVRLGALAALGDGGSAPGPPAGGRCSSPYDPQQSGPVAMALRVEGEFIRPALGRGWGEWSWV